MKRAGGAAGEIQGGAVVGQEGQVLLHLRAGRLRHCPGRRAPAPAPATAGAPPTHMQQCPQPLPASFDPAEEILIPQRGSPSLITADPLETLAHLQNPDSQKPMHLQLPFESLQLCRSLHPPLSLTFNPPPLPSPSAGRRQQRRWRGRGNLREGHGVQEGPVHQQGLR
jgi:hypothetical protein